MWYTDTQKAKIAPKLSCRIGCRQKGRKTGAYGRTYMYLERQKTPSLVSV